MGELIISPELDILPPNLKSQAYQTAGFIAMCYKFCIPVHKVRIWEQRGYVNAPIEYPTSRFAPEHFNAGNSQTSANNKILLARRLKIFTMIHIAGAVARFRSEERPPVYNMDVIRKSVALAPDIEIIIDELDKANQLLGRQRFSKMDVLLWHSATQVFFAKNKIWRGVAKLANSLIEVDDKMLSGSFVNTTLSNRPYR
jgi:hypothetical protein